MKWLFNPNASGEKGIKSCTEAMRNGMKEESLLDKLKLGTITVAGAAFMTFSIITAGTAADDAKLSTLPPGDNATRSALVAHKQAVENNAPAEGVGVTLGLAALAFGIIAYREGHDRWTKGNKVLPAPKKPSGPGPNPDFFGHSKN